MNDWSAVHMPYDNISNFYGISHVDAHKSIMWQTKEDTNNDYIQPMMFWQ